MTIAELTALKGKRQVIATTAFDEWTARAAEDAGVDLIVAWGNSHEHTKFIVESVRKGAPNTLIGTGINPGAYESTEKAMMLANEVQASGADIIYASGIVPCKFKPLADQWFACCGHVGYRPVNNTWYGGPRAVGKTAEEAKKVYDEVMAFEAAGCIAIEMECVPAQLAAEIAKRTKMLIISMGSGGECDGQYLFSEDLAGFNIGHYPRHAIRYANVYQDTVNALKQYREDVISGAYPARKHTIQMKDEEYARFMQSIS